MFNPHQLITKARNGALSVGEAHSLSVHVSGLERALQHHTQTVISASRGETVSVCLNEDCSSLLVVFPGQRQHAVSLPLARPDLAFDFLVKALRERRGKPANFIGSGGAPTQADIEALTKVFLKTKQVKKIKNKKESIIELTLDELELSLEDLETT